jgi:hypothetical protein
MQYQNNILSYYWLGCGLSAGVFGANWGKPASSVSERCRSQETRLCHSLGSTRIYIY